MCLPTSHVDITTHLSITHCACLQIYELLPIVQIVLRIYRTTNTGLYKCVVKEENVINMIENLIILK